MMQRRDRQNEMVVALIVIVAMAFALIFGIMLSLDSQDEAESEETPAPDSTRPVEEEHTVEVEVETATLTLTRTLTPTQTLTQTPTLTATLTATVKPSRTPRPTRILALTHTPHQASDTISETLVFLTNAPTKTPFPTATDIPVTNTPTEISKTPSPQATATIIPFSTETPPSCQPRTDWEAYEVWRGDTLFSLALYAGISLDDLALANCITDKTRIFAGQILYLPPGSAGIQDVAIENCDRDNARILSPPPGASVDGFVSIQGVAYGDDFRRYILDWRPDDPTIDFKSFEEIFEAVTEPGELGRFNSDAFEPGLYWFRLRVLESRDYILGECSIRVRFR